MARAPQHIQTTLLLLLLLPSWTSFPIRIYAWMGRLKNNGLINNLLMSLGIIDDPILMMNTNFAVYIGIVYAYLPFMVLPLYANLEKHGHSLLEASEDLGAKPWKTFLFVTLQLSKSVVIAGSMLVFISAVGEFVIPELLGGPDTLMIYSFNESRLVTVWAGFSTKSYAELFKDKQLLDAIGMSLKIVFWSSCMAVVLGTMAAFVMTRYGRFRGKTAFSNMITAPLVMPDVITGLSLLLLFVAMANAIGWPEERGMLTIWIAHVTFCSAYATVVISSRLREVDRSIEEAAMDLGATPFKTFFQITLPGIAPALAAGWLLSFTLSLDDLVIASFVSGPGATILPMVVFSSVRLGIRPKINALATLIILAISLGSVYHLVVYASTGSPATADDAIG